MLKYNENHGIVNEHSNVIQLTKENNNNNDFSPIIFLNYFLKVLFWNLFNYLFPLLAVIEKVFKCLKIV